MRVRIAVTAIVSALLVSAALATVAAATGGAGSFHSPARIISSGHEIAVGGRISCAAGDPVSVRVTLTQPATHAYAEGTWNGSCTGTAEHWSVTAQVSDGATLQSGCVQAAALALTTSIPTIGAAEQWFRSQLPAEIPHHTVYCLHRV